MLSKATWVFRICTPLAGLLWIAFFCFYPLNTSSESPAFTKTENREVRAFQNRYGVSKEVWLARKERKCFRSRLLSESSVVTLHNKGSKFELVEDLENVQCWMQDRESSPEMQEIRLITASHGKLNGNTHQFTAENVDLIIYQTPGEDPPESFYPPTCSHLHGNAKSISLTIEKKHPHFEAEEIDLCFN